MLRGFLLRLSQLAEEVIKDCLKANLDVVEINPSWWESRQLIAFHGNPILSATGRL